jgi:hypothetical protein
MNADLWDMAGAKQINRIIDGSYSPISIIKMLKSGRKDICNQTELIGRCLTV